MDGVSEGKIQSNQTERVLFPKTIGPLSKSVLLMLRLIRERDKGFFLVEATVIFVSDTLDRSLS